MDVLKTVFNRRLEGKDRTLLDAIYFREFVEQLFISGTSRKNGFIGLYSSRNFVHSIWINRFFIITFRE